MNKLNHKSIFDLIINKVPNCKVIKQGKHTYFETNAGEPVGQIELISSRNYLYTVYFNFYYRTDQGVRQSVELANLVTEAYKKQAEGLKRNIILEDRVNNISTLL